MICIYCARPIIPHAPRIEIDGRGPAHVGCAAIQTMQKAVAEMDARESLGYQRPVVWENGRNLTVHFEGPLKGCEGYDVEIDVTRANGSGSFTKGLGKPISFGLDVSVYEIPDVLPIRRGDKVYLSAERGDVGVMGIECENRSVLDANGCVATANAADRGRQELCPRCGNGVCKACHRTIEPGEPTCIGDGVLRHEGCHRQIIQYRAALAEAERERNSEPENSDRLLAPETQQLSTFTSRRFPGMHVAVVGFQGADYPPNKVEEAINDPGLETMLMSLRFKRVVEAVIEITGTENVACRFASLDRDLRRMSILIHRQGVFQHDHALWAEFLRMIG